MEEEAKINSIGDILGSTFKNGAEYSNTAKTAIFFSFWKDIVGLKYESKTKPYSLKLGKLYVACQNSFVLQEISMYKKDILKKANIYSHAVDINIDDIVFGYKNWNSLSKEIDVNDEYEENSPFDFSNLSIDDLEIKDMVSKINFLNDEQKEKLTLDIKNNLIKEKTKKKI